MEETGLSLILLTARKRYVARDMLRRTFRLLLSLLFVLVFALGCKGRESSSEDSDASEFSLGVDGDSPDSGVEVVATRTGESSEESEGKGGVEGPEGYVLCDEEWIDPDVDENYCGASGNCLSGVSGEHCPEGVPCLRGKCRHHDADLVVLTVTPGEMSVEFTPRLKTHIVSLEAGVTEVIVTAIASDPDAIVMLDEELLSESTVVTVGSAGLSTHSIVVKTMGGAESKYELILVHQQLVQEAYLKAETPREAGYFGTSLALDGDTLAVGGDGEVSILLRGEEGWRQQARLTVEDAESENYFGSSLALSGDTLAVGAPGGQGDGTESSPGIKGRVYLYQREDGEWSQQGSVEDNKGEDYHSFGSRLALDGGTLAVGVVYPARVVVFQRKGSTWNEEARLASNQGGAFGTSVSLFGDMLAVGAPNEDGASGRAAGIVYLFERGEGEWLEQASFQVPVNGENNGFGRKVALLAGRLAASSPRENAVFLFERRDGEWSQEARIQRPEWAAVNSFGDAGFSLSDTTLAVGGFFGGGSEGVVYLFESNGQDWSERAVLQAANEEAPDHFGASVALSGDTLVVGAPYEEIDWADTEGEVHSSAGAVYVISGMKL